MTESFTAADARGEHKARATAFLAAASPRPPLRPALAVLSLPLVAAQYSSTSPQELQRRLERDTDQLIDSLRSQRNSPSRARAPSGPSPWELELNARAGTGGLPRSAELADRLQAAALKMTMADAEVGDRFAADFIGECYRNGTNGVTADPIQALAWLRYAAEMGNPSSARTLAQTDATSLNRTPAEILHWTAVRDACEYNEFLPKPPRRPIGGRIDLTAVRPQLEAAISALNTFRTKKPGELTAGQEDAEMIRTDTAKAALQKNPAHGLVLLAQIAATGNRYIAHDITNILARGDDGVQPDAALAQRFHTAALGLLERDAEYGDMNAAARLAAYALGLGEKPDVPSVLRWLT